MYYFTYIFVACIVVAIITAHSLHPTFVKRMTPTALITIQVTTRVEASMLRFKKVLAIINKLCIKLSSANGIAAVLDIALELRILNGMINDE